MAWWSFWKKRGTDLRGKRLERPSEADADNSEAQTQPQAPAPGTELSVEEMIAQALRPALFLRKTPNPNDPGAKGCWLGGEPSLPSDIDWPYYEYEDYPRVPMHFLAQIELSEILQASGLPALPRTGTLFFFVDPIFAPHNDLVNGCKVIYSPESCLTAPIRLMPPLPDIDEEKHEVSLGYELSPTRKYNKWNFAFEEVDRFEDGLPFAASMTQQFLEKTMRP